MIYWFPSLRPLRPFDIARGMLCARYSDLKFQSIMPLVAAGVAWIGVDKQFFDRHFPAN